MGYDYKKISTNWNKFLAEGAFNLNEDEEPNLVGKRITKPPKKGKGKIVDNILSKLPKPLQSKPMKAALAVGIRAVKDKEVSVKDVWSFVKAATNFAMAGDEESKALAKKQLDAEKVAQLPKVNVDIVFSGLLPVPKDPGFAPPDELTGSRVPAPTGGLASMRLTFEEWLNADESVNLLTEEDNPIVSRKLTFDNPRKPTIAIMTITLKGGEEYVAKTRIRNGNVGSAKSRAMRAAEKKMLAAAPSR